jgi:curved DNA-binding protein CbpA
MDDRSERCPRCAALQLLGVGIDATETEIKAAYRLLVKVWHPDRFPGDPKLKEAAENKLKVINSAFVLLTTPAAKRGPAQRPSQATAYAAPPASAQPPAASGTGKTAPIEIPSWIPSFRFWPVAKFVFKIAMLAVVILCGRYLWIAFDLQDSVGDEATSVYKSGKNTLLSGLEAPKRRFLDAIERDLQRFEWSRSSSESVSQPAIVTADNQHPKKIHATPHPDQPEVHVLKPYLTVGSTRDEVITQQGTPTASSEDKLVYGKSELYLKDNAVIGWRIDPVSSPIRVKLWPQASVDPDLGFFTIGSSKDEVLVVQGTPTAFTDDQFEYGTSVVYFQKNRVIRWKNGSRQDTLYAK